MYLNHREQIILSELLRNETSVSLEQLVRLLKVSKRTVYREISNLEQSIQSYHATIERIGNGRLALTASKENIAKLQTIIGSVHQVQFLSSSERQHAILIQLLLTSKPLSKDFFIQEYQISTPTFFSDIKQLETNIEKLPLKIVRNIGYEIESSEKNRRLLLANTLMMEINDYHFFNLQALVDQENYFLRFIQSKHLLLAQRLAKRFIESHFSELSDRKMEFIILMLTLAMDRVENGFFVSEEIAMYKINKEELIISKKIFEMIGQEIHVMFSINEILFIAMLLDDLTNSFDHDFFEEYFDTDLAYKVKRLIELVSEQTENDFYEDTVLYKMLLTHISGVLARTVMNTKELSNPMLVKIVEEYQEIATAIKTCLVPIFSSNQFSEEEVAYMVLHFANSLEKNPKKIEINIAGVSPTGLASTSILESRLRKHFPFINEITFFRLSDLSMLKNDNKYDLILSTSVLSGYDGAYKLVSPLILEAEVQELKKEFRVISSKKKSITSIQEATTNDSYEETITLMTEINQLLCQFEIKTIDNSLDLDRTLYEIVQQIPVTQVKKAKPVAKKIIHRYKQSPIGIPNTTMGLFHSISTQVQEPVFQLFDLTHSLVIEGMDKQSMTLKRVLLMLAPDPIPENTSKLLGRISRSIIVNNLTMEIFNSGNQQIIFQLLSSLLVENLKF